MEPTTRYPQPVDGLDRTPGRRVGHVLVLDRAGALLADVTVGEATSTTPVASPSTASPCGSPSRSTAPTAARSSTGWTPRPLEVTEEFRVDDHVGGVVRDPGTGDLHGVSWGFAQPSSTGRRAARSWTAAPNHVLDIQDCDHAGDGRQARSCTSCRSRRRWRGTELVFETPIG